MGILIGFVVIFIMFCMCWERVIGNGMIVGVVFGIFLVLIMWLLVVVINEGGFNMDKFFENIGGY